MGRNEELHAADLGIVGSARRTAHHELHHLSCGGRVKGRHVLIGRSEEAAKGSRGIVPQNELAVVKDRMGEIDDNVGTLAIGKGQPQVTRAGHCRHGLGEKPLLSRDLDDRPGARG